MNDPLTPEGRAELRELLDSIESAALRAEAQA